MTTPRLRQAAEILTSTLEVKSGDEGMLAIVTGDFSCMAYKHTKAGASLLNLEVALNAVKAALDAEKEQTK